MHNIDRTQPGFWGEAESFQPPYMGEAEGESEGIFSEDEEMELASELLSVNNEAELDQFLGDFLSKAVQTVGRAISSPVGQAITGGLKSIAKKALPMAGAALGNMIVPGIGGAIGGQLASGAGSLFGLELEGMSAEDREFEVARRIIRLGGEAVQQAAANPRPQAAPQAAAQSALLAAAQQHAPGLAAELTGQPQDGMAAAGHGGRRHGRWYELPNGDIVLVTRRGRPAPVAFVGAQR